jgi:flagellar biosynthesis protein FlhF
MGAEAIIVATHEDEGTRGVRVTAASDAEDRHISEKERTITFETLQLVGNALDDHGTPPELVDRILNSVAAQAVSDPHMALAGALQSIFKFLPLPESGNQSRPIMLIGPPGGGKTSAAAKMAARAVIAGHSIRLITTDTVRAQGIEQLESYATRLGLNVVPAPDPLALIEAIENSHPEDLIVIDTMGVNPYSPEDMGKLVDLTSAIAVEPILVLTAGRDPIEATEIVKAYGEVAPSRMLVTGLDMVRRLGSVLASIDTSGLAFSDVSPTPNIVNGMRPMNQVSLSRLLLPSEPAQTVDIASTRSSRRQVSGPSKSPQEPPQEEAMEDDKLAPTGSN